MAGKRNVAMERLEFENRHLRELITKLREEPPDTPFIGCDSACVVAPPSGMHTNGGCRCEPARLRQAVLYYRRRCLYLQATIIELRDGRPEESYRVTAERFIKDTNGGPDGR